MPRLSKRIVDEAAPAGKPFFVWCSDLAGFGLRIYPTGRKVYFVDYRADGKRRRMALGKHGVVTCDQARRLALKILGGVVDGDDPLTERRTRRGSLTVGQLCDDYLRVADKGLILGKGGTPKKASTLEIDRGRIDAHIKPLLGKMLVIDIRQSDVAKFIRDVTAGKTARADAGTRLRGRVRITGGPGTAARAAGLLGGILSFAVGEGVVEFNAARGVRKPASLKRGRRLSAADYRALAKALDQVEEIAPQGVTILRFAALTGCRIGEVESLKWAELDLTGQVLRLADSKTGRSVRPIGRKAVEVLQGVKAVAGNPYVFPAPRLEGLAYAGGRRFYRSAFTSAGLAGATPHTLRHSFASVAADLGFADSTIGACLGHAVAGITGRYTHRLDQVLIAAADRIAGEIDRQMRTGKAAKMGR